MRSQSTVLSRKRYNRFWILCPEQGVCLGVTCGVRRWWTLIPCKQRGGCTNQSLYLINVLFKQLPKSAISREVRTSSFYNIFKQDISHLIPWPRGFTVTWCGWCGLCFWHNPTELAHSSVFCSCVYFCLHGPFNCISFHKLSRQLSAFSLYSSGLISALLVLSTVYLFMKIFLSSDIILCGWLELKHKLTN